jgi:transketolase N-terminal domain/subunit
MDIILGALISFLTQIFKWLSQKLGKETSKTIVLSVVFGLVAIFTYLTKSGLLPMDVVQNFINMLGSAIATYELITKPLMKAIGEEK